MHGIFTYNVVGKYSMHGAGLEGTKRQYLSQTFSLTHHEVQVLRILLEVPSQICRCAKVASQGLMPSKRRASLLVKSLFIYWSSSLSDKQFTTAVFVSVVFNSPMMTRASIQILTTKSPFVLGPTNGSALSGGFSRFSWTVHRGFCFSKKIKKDIFQYQLVQILGDCHFRILKGSISDDVGDSS